MVLMHPMRDGSKGGLFVSATHRDGSPLAGGAQVAIGLQRPYLCSGYRVVFRPMKRQTQLSAAIFFLLASALTRASQPSGGEVRAVVTRFESAWNKHDMDSLANLFRSDADFVNVYGMHVIVRADGHWLIVATQNTDLVPG